MRPTNDTALQRPDLGAAVFETMQAAPTMGFIGLQVMPIFPVSRQSAEYPVIPAEALFNVLETARSSGGAYNRSSGEFESGFYKTVDKGLERPVDDRYAAIYSSLFDYEMTIAMILMNDILRAQEKRVADKIFSATNFTATNAGTAWSTAASADPRGDVEAGKESLRGNGIVANTLVLNYTAYQDAKLCDDVQEKVYQIFPDAAKTGIISIEHLRAYFDVEKLLVAGALYNSSKRGQDASLSDIWGSQYCMLCRTSDRDITEPCIGRTFKWNEGATEDVIVEEYREENVRSKILRVRHDVSESFLLSYDEDGSAKSEISKACGYLIDATAGS